MGNQQFLWPLPSRVWDYSPPFRVPRTPAITVRVSCDYEPASGSLVYRVFCFAVRLRVRLRRNVPGAVAAARSQVSGSADHRHSVSHSARRGSVHYCACNLPPWNHYRRVAGQPLKRLTEIRLLFDETRDPPSPSRLLKLRRAMDYGAAGRRGIRLPGETLREKLPSRFS